MLIRDCADQVFPPFSENGKRTIFLVPEVCLVAQQAKVIEQHTPLKVGQYIGSMNVDAWDKAMWVKEAEENHVLVMTAEIFRRIITHSMIPLSKINLIIFDEASCIKQELSVRC